MEEHLGLHLTIDIPKISGRRWAPSTIDIFFNTAWTVVGYFSLCLNDLSFMILHIYMMLTSVWVYYILLQWG